MSTLPVLKPADFASDQDVRWCPGCGDYSILAQMKKVLRNWIPAKNGLHQWNWLRSRFPTHEYLWDA